MTVVYDKDGRLELRTYSSTECGDTITAYVPDAIAANYHFTSAIAVQLLKAIEPQLEPPLRSPPTDAPPPAISQIDQCRQGSGSQQILRQ